MKTLQWATFLILGVISVWAQDLPQATRFEQPNYAQDELLVRFRPLADRAQIDKAHSRMGARVLKSFRHLEGLQRVRLGTGVTVQDAIAEYRKDSAVLYAEPNYRLQVGALPNDPSYSQLWGMKAIGAEQAWDVTTGSQNVVVAVIDTGMDYNHPDLTANLWSNPQDCDNDGLDDDANGYVDDCHGIDLVNLDSDPMDDHFHGTHVAGTIGAAGNNSIGVAGVSWSVKILACKFLDANGTGWLSDAVTCLDYLATLKDMGLNIVASNNSWGSTTFNPVLYVSETLRDAIRLQMEKGILFVVAATNGGGDGKGDDNDLTSPAAMVSTTDLPNVISVAAVDSAGNLAIFSNFGRHSVHLAAPGVNVLSSVPASYDPVLYRAFSGTSMATPHVTGSVALLKAWNPSLTWYQVRHLLLAGVNKSPAASQTVSRGVLSLPGAMNCADTVLLERTRPMPNIVTAAEGATLVLEMIHIRCALPNGAMTVIANGTPIILQDDGQSPDAFAGDGVYSASWAVPGQGSYTVSFPNGDDVSVQVLRPYTFAAVSQPARQITGTSLKFTQAPFEVKEIASPFPVMFGGAPFSKVYVAAGGTLSFASPFAELWAYPMPFGQAHNVVAPFWDLLLPVEQPPLNVQNVYWDVLGTAPSRELVVEWRDVTRATSTNRLTETVRFQAVMFEGKPDILFVYPDVMFGGDTSAADGAARATVGIQTSPSDAVQYSYRLRSLNDGDALLWTIIDSAELTAPVIDSLSPASVIQGPSDRSMTISGRNFTPEAVVRLFGYDDPPPVFVPTSVSATEITFTVPGTYLQLEGGILFSVRIPGHGESNQIPLTIAPSPTAPRISSLNPTYAMGGSTTSLTLGIQGQRFAAGAQVQFDGVTKPSTFISANELRITLTGADLRSGGFYSVKVFGETEASNVFFFTIADYELRYLGNFNADVKQGGSASYQLQAISLFRDFTNPVNLSCSNLPAGAKCQFPQSSITPGGGQVFDVTLTTTAPPTSSAYAQPMARSAVAFGFLLPPFLMAGLGMRSRKRKWLGAMMVLTLAMAFVACGGGGGGPLLAPAPTSQAPPPASVVTPPGNYSITVQATSGNITHSITVGLTVTAP